MTHLNVEIKARCPDPEVLREMLRSFGGTLRGVERQADTYFRCASGRLKLREGDSENSLIFCARANQAGPKESRVTLCPVGYATELRTVLDSALGILCTVRKRREIWFVGTVKVHIDEVESLGSFLEIEATEVDGSIGRAHLHELCSELIAMLTVQPENLLECSYCDLLLASN